MKPRVKRYTQSLNLTKQFVPGRERHWKEGNAIPNTTMNNPRQTNDSHKHADYSGLGSMLYTAGHLGDCIYQTFTPEYPVSDANHIIVHFFSPTDFLLLCSRPLAFDIRDTNWLCRLRQIFRYRYNKLNV